MPLPDDPAAPAVVSVFGGPKVTVGSTLVRLSPYQAALVGAVFGAEVGGGLTRAQLIQLLWQEDVSTSARHRLSQLLYSLGRKTDPVSLTVAEGERIRPDFGAAEADIRIFRRALNTGSLVVAADLVRRGFLAQLPLIPTRAYRDWIDARRATLRSRVRDRAAAQARQASAEHRWDAAEEGASILLDLSPQDEDALRNLMWIRAMRGRIDEALAAHQGLIERASAENPDWRCEEETEELLDRIRNLRTRASPPPELRHLEPQPDPPLCGRDAELAGLSKIVASETEAGLSTVVIEGEAGIGKTRLANEGIRAARLLGFRTLRARSSEFEQDIPFNPILGALDEHAVGVALSRLEDPWRSVLLALMPQFHWEDGPLPEVPYVQPGSVPRRMFEAIRRLVEEIAVEAPLLLFLDDFQWADETSVAALEFLRRRWSEGRLVLVLAVRPEPLGNRSRAFQFARELTSVDEVVHVELGELPDAAAEKLVRSVASRHLTGREVREILSLGGRNPFFLLELTLEYLEGRMALRTEPGDHLQVPASIRQVLERRLTSLETAAQQVLEVMAVYGRDLSLDLLQAMCKLDREASLHGLDQLQRFRLIEWMGTGTGVRHGLIRHTAHARLTPARQALLHERIARALQRNEEGSSPDELALHFDKAGIRDEALKYALESADRADAAGAVAEALRFLGMARRHAEDEELLADIIGRLGHLHYLHRNLSEAVPFLEVAASRLESEEKWDRALSTNVERLDALSRLEAFERKDLLLELGTLKRQAWERRQWDTIAQALEVEIHVFDRHGDAAGVREVLKEADELARKAPRSAQCGPLYTLGAHQFYGSPEIALASLQRAVALAEELEQWEHLLRASVRLSMIHVCQGLMNSPEAREAGRTAQSLLRKSGDLAQKFHYHENKGVWHVDIGEYEVARTHFQEARRLTEDSSSSDLDAVLDVNLGELELWCRNISAARHHFSKLESTDMWPIQNGVQEIVDAGLGLCALYSGELGKARRHAESLPDDSTEWHFDRTLSVMFLARLKRAQGRSSEATETLRRASKRARGRFVPGWLRLQTEEVRLRMKNGKDGDEEKTREIARAAMETATALGLVKQVRQLQNLVPDVETRK